MRYLITETCDYTIEAETDRKALDIFLQDGPEVRPEGPVKFVGVSARLIEEAP